MIPGSLNLLEPSGPHQACDRTASGDLTSGDKKLSGSWSGYLAAASREERHTNYHKMKTVLRIQVLWDVMLCHWASSPLKMMAKCYELCLTTQHHLKSQKVCCFDYSINCMSAELVDCHSHN
jgi:hypothetical protein